MIPVPPISFGLTAPTTGGNVNVNNNAGAGGWPFGGSGGSDIWKTATIALAALAALLITHRLRLGK